MWILGQNAYIERMPRNPTQPVRLVSVMRIFQTEDRKDFPEFRAAFMSHQAKSSLVLGVGCFIWRMFLLVPQSLDVEL